MNRRTFYSNLGKLRNHGFRLTKSDHIRLTKGSLKFCPIEAVYYDRTGTQVDYELAAEELGLSELDMEIIIDSADATGDIESSPEFTRREKACRKAMQKRLGINQ